MEAAMDNPLKRMGELGQSFWYDNLNRDFVQSGGLQRMIDEDGLTGVTSNPTIFEKAIGGQRTYDHDLHALVDLGKTVYEIYENLAVADIRETADLLRPVYERTSGADGFVSLEVAPELAFDHERTLEQVRRLFALVDRENVMIKVPATPQGTDAVKILISEGININITLIFSMDQYRRTAMAYIEGMEKWVESGGDPGKVASVASFFVSRVDTLFDDLLNEISDPALVPKARELTGKVAIGNAKSAYALFKELFHGDRFAALRDKGAKPQRVLWASTSTKNPAYPDTYYVDALLGPETVNTIPDATIDAFRDHGKPESRLEEGLEEALRTIPRLEELSIDVDDAMDKLLEDGVRSFADSFDKLLEGIATKRSRLLRGWGHRSASLGILQQKVDETVSRFDEEKVTQNIWERDPAVWTDDPNTMSEIGQRLGWLTVVDTMRKETSRLSAFAEEIKSAGFTRAVLLGMGGSSLAAEVFYSCLGTAPGFLDLKVLDTTVPGSILEVQRQLDLEHTLFIVSSKSGGTIEVLTLYRYFRHIVEEAVGDRAGGHFIAITDPGTSLGKLASENGFRRVFLNPPDIGGRFSALSYFGLVPAALIGADLDRLLLRASQAVEASGAEVPALESPGLWLGVVMGLASLAGEDKLTLITSPQIRTFGLWLEQLLAESTGKEDKGIVPIDSEPIGEPEDYSKDRLFVYLRIDNEGAYDGQVSALEKAGQKVITLRLHTPYDVGREIFRWEFATAGAGKILGINPFDQPNVQEAKDLTGKVLDRYRNEGTLPDGEKWDIDDPGLPEALKAIVETVKPGDYVAFNAFVTPSPEAVEALQAMRAVVRHGFRVPTTLGFGPRFLHSTGQLHKGGADNGVFFQITCDDAEDIATPGEGYSFGVLKNAQALGDYEALAKRGRRIIRVHLRSPADLAKLRGAIEAVC
jgi:transaldolase / glucose-6-phosphate isomerase